MIVRCPDCRLLWDAALHAADCPHHTIGALPVAGRPGDWPEDDDDA